jgi:hypothetical protein
VIGQSNVADVCREICESIVELERAFEAGELSSRLTSACFEQVLGPLLYETYRKLPALRVRSLGRALAKAQRLPLKKGTSARPVGNSQVNLHYSSV